MKIPGIVNAVGHIDENLINDAMKAQKEIKKSVRIKRSSFAACFAILLIAAVIAASILRGDGNTTFPVISGDTTTSNSENTVHVTGDNTTATLPTISQDTTQAVTETALSEAYFYNVSDGVFSDYISGKVITEDKISSKLEDVTVTAGWKNNKHEWLTNETLRAEVYRINGISEDVAVALKFIDKGDALTTTHYYVIMKPDADLSGVREYVIASFVPKVTVDENGEETTVNEITDEEIVVGYTSQANN